MSPSILLDEIMELRVIISRIFLTQAEHINADTTWFVWHRLKPIMPFVHLN